MNYDPVMAARGQFRLFDRPDSLIQLKEVGYVSQEFCVIGGALYHPRHTFDIDDLRMAIDAFWQARGVYLASNGDRFVLPFVAVIDGVHAIVQGHVVVIPSMDDVSRLGRAVSDYWRNA